MKRFLYSVLWIASAMLSNAGIPQSAHASPVLDSGNGHYYELVRTNVDWDTANTAAMASTYLGYSGHLATVTSAAENLFLSNTFLTQSVFYWIGGYQPPGSTEPGGGWSWVTNEPFSYSNWASGEPNDFGNENRITFWLELNADGVAWNDLNQFSGTDGYIVEYEPAQATVPEPSSLALMGFGAISLAASAYRRRFRPATA